MMPTGAATSRPRLPAWQARSFWLTLFTILTPLAASHGIDLPGLVGVRTTSAAADAVVVLLPVLTGLWAWAERWRPGFDLDFGPLERLAGRGD